MQEFSIGVRGGEGVNLNGQNCEQRGVTIRGYRQKHVIVE